MQIAGQGQFVSAALVRPRMDAMLTNGAVDSRTTRAIHAGVASGSEGVESATRSRSTRLKKQPGVLLVKTAT
ncbi:hypothetical protein [Streptomyces sviceus]|uniref:hypothetical protein n=1 Tax=Streptomyces sviceus TaxID=285530 RepID=UPI003325A3C6